MRATSCALLLLLTPTGLFGQVDSLSPPSDQGVFVETDVDSAIVFIDDERAGTTPLTVGNLAPGVHVIRVQHPLVERWLYPVVQDTIEVLPGESLHLRYRLARRFSVRSVPFGAQVVRNGDLIGTTPLFFETAPEDTVTLRLTGYRTHQIALNSAVDGQLFVSLDPLEGTLPPEYLMEGSGKGGPEVMPLVLSGTSMLVAGVFSAYFKVQADEAYSQYLATGDPVKRAETRRLDAVAGLALATTTMFVGLFTYLLLSP